jgi:hypothetical protein
MVGSSRFILFVISRILLVFIFSGFLWVFVGFYLVLCGVGVDLQNFLG